MPHVRGQHYASWHREILCLVAQGNTMPHVRGQHYASWHREILCLAAQGNTMPHVRGQHYASWHRTLCFMAQCKQANVNNTWLPFFAPSKGQIKVSASTSDLLRLWPNKPNFPLCNTCTHHLAIQSQSLKFHGNTFFSSSFFFFFFFQGDTWLLFYQSSSETKILQVNCFLSWLLFMYHFFFCLPFCFSCPLKHIPVCLVCLLPSSPLKHVPVCFGLFAPLKFP